jgi:hypothetical protein
VAAFTARAIVVGQATAWHLFLPMVGEYLVLLASMPVICLILHDSDPAERCPQESLVAFHDRRGRLALDRLASSFDEGTAWTSQARVEFSRLYTWITTHQMHWPILGAMAAMIGGLPGRVAAFHRHGPPFMAVGLGCAMRLIIPLFGCFLIPFIAAGKSPHRLVDLDDPPPLRTRRALHALGSPAAARESRDRGVRQAVSHAKSMSS